MAKAASRTPVPAPGKGTHARPPRLIVLEFVYGQNKSRFLYLKLMPGTFLDETELSNQFGVSRSPVREALTPNADPLDQLRRDHVEHEPALNARDIRLLVHRSRIFHIGLADVGGNPLISRWMGPVLDQGQRLLGLYGMHLPERMPADILKPHRDMLDAIADKNPDAAETAASADAMMLIEDIRESLARRASDGMAVSSRKESARP